MVIIGVVLGFLGTAILVWIMVCFFVKPDPITKRDVSQIAVRAGMAIVMLLLSISALEAGGLIK